jgi:hypothetical protein
MSKVAPLLAILLLLSFDASAQFFNPVIPGPYKGPFGTAGPLPFTSQNAAASYDNGGQGLGYNVPSPGCTGAACAGGSLSYRPDVVNFKASTFGPGFNYELAFSVSPVSYNYTTSFSQPGPYTITLWVGSASAGGSWNVYIDKQLVGTVATPNTGSYTLLAPAVSSPFNATIGTHVLTLAWGSGDASGNAGDIVAWQGSVVTSGSQFDVARNTGTNFSFSADHLTATALTNAPTNSDFSAFVTRQQSDVKRFFRFTVGTKSSGCGQGVGVATGTEINGAYLGHGGANSVGIFADGSTSLNNGSIGSTGITFASGDVIDLIVDPNAKTIQEVKNGGAASVALNIAALSTQNVSPAVSLCAINDSVVYNGNPNGVSYPGATAWDTPPAAQIPTYTAYGFDPSTSNGPLKIYQSGTGGDGTWSQVSSSYATQPTFLRDPRVLTDQSGNIAKYNGLYWMAHTDTNATSSSFALASSTDGLNWTYVKDIDCSPVTTGSGGFCWAPSFYMDNGGGMHTITSMSPPAQHFQQYEQHPTTSDPAGAWSAPSIVSGLPSTSTLDAKIVRDGTAIFRAFYVNGTGSNEHVSEATSSVDCTNSGCGGYTEIHNGDWAGWGNNQESPSLLKIGSTWNIWFYYFGSGITNFTRHSTTSDISGTTWSSVTDPGFGTAMDVTAVAVVFSAPPLISGVTVSPGVFHTPSTNPVETLVANCVGSCAGATFSLPSTATAGCTAAQIAQNGLFTISGNNLNAVSTINGTPTENVGIVVTKAGATGSGTCYPFALTGNSAAGVACNIGPTFLGTIPAPAQMAGLTTCAANYDFTDLSYATLTNWLDCSQYGTAGGGQYQWHIGQQGFPSWNQCNQFAMVNDPSIGKMVLQIEYPSGTNSIESMETQGSLGTGPIELGFPYVYYIETTYKMVQLCGGCGQNNGGPNGLFVWNNDNGNGLLEDDLGEIYVDTGGFGDKGWINWTGGSPGPGDRYFLASFSGQYPSGWSPTAYAKYGTLVTNNGSQAYWCTYIDDHLIGGGCFPIPGTKGAAMLGQTDNVLIHQTQGANNPQVYDLQTQYIRVWECPGFVSNSSKCLTQATTSTGPNGETYFHQ